ncbi:MAG: hypothetical protein E5Y74_15215 [Mesorhizobium sp.]|nr:MAG: hypothetical protein E5Y74_15215 [Mesorhizobium sp.]
MQAKIGRGNTLDGLRLMHVPLAILLTWPRVATANECLSKYTKTDVCAYAKKMQTEMAPALPMLISSNISVRSIIAIGPRIVFNATWAQTDAEVDAKLLAAGVSRPVYVQKIDEMTKNYVCRAEELSAFVRLGGEIQYTYTTVDNFPVANPLVALCP